MFQITSTVYAIIPILFSSQFLPVQAILLFVSLLLFGYFVTRWPGNNVRIKPIRGSRFRKELIPANLDTIVVGSGSGGCACANLLAQSGQRVLLLEQHERTGGCTHSFQQEGCEWDTGLHYTSKTMSQKTKRAGAIMDFMTKGMQKFTQLQDPYDEVVFPPDNQVKPGLPNMSSYPFVAGVDQTVTGIMENIDPYNYDLRNKVNNYMDICLEIDGGFTALGISRILPSWLHFLVQKRIDRLMKLASFTVRDVQYAVFNLGFTTEQLLAEGCPTAPPGPEPDPSIRRLKAVLTHPIGDYAVQPRDATMAAHGITMSHYRNGGCYTVGPTQNISVRSSSMVREFGGEVLVDATVREIIVEKGRAVGVRVSSTSALAKEDPTNVSFTEIRAKNIVWASGIYNLYTKMLPQYLSVVKEFHDPTKRTVRQSNGHVFLFCKLKGDATELGLPTHNLWYFNGYNLDEAFDAYFANPTEIRPPTVYIGFPCTKDITWKKRFPGVSNCILISDGLWEWFAKWQDQPVHNRGKDYEEFKEKLTKHLFDILYDVVPEAKGRVEYHTLGTPLSEVTYLSSYQGGSYGTKCLTSLFDTINHRWTTTPHTSIPGLTLAGSDAYLPAVCGAMYGGTFGACAVLGHFGTMRMVWAFLNHFAALLQEDNPKLSWPRAFFLALQKFGEDD